SRRRHTRFSRDWSSDVCSSDLLTTAHAGGWATVHKYVKRSGKCAGQEVLASWYASGKRTASGERFNANGNTAAARTWPLGTRLRSEERRVGKECRARGWRKQET